MKINSEYINLRFNDNDLEVNIDSTTYRFSATSVNDYKFVSFSTNNMASLKQMN